MLPAAAVDCLLVSPPTPASGNTGHSFDSHSVRTRLVLHYGAHLKMTESSGGGGGGENKFASVE